MNNHKTIYKSVVLSVFAFMGLLALISGTPAHAADYSVGASGWTPQNSWSNYWTNNPNGNMNWNEPTTTYKSSYNSNWNTNNNTATQTSWNGYTAVNPAGTGGMTYANNNYNANAYPKVVHGLPTQVRTGQDMYNVQTGQMTGVRAYTQSVTPGSFTTTVCAQDMVNGTSYHLGCVPQATYSDSANGPSRFDFNVWPAMVNGQHHISYTYRDAMGNWVPVQTPWNGNYQTSI